MHKLPSRFDPTLTAEERRVCTMIRLHTYCNKWEECVYEYAEVINIDDLISALNRFGVDVFCTPFDLRESVEEPMTRNGWVKVGEPQLRRFTLKSTTTYMTINTQKWRRDND